MSISCATESATCKRKDCPGAFDFSIDEMHSRADTATGFKHYETSRNELDNKGQPNEFAFATGPEPFNKSDQIISRASSITPLDPYYFGVLSPSDWPHSSTSSIQPSTTPERRQIFEPATPVRDPATIDRRGLVGVGELATPRWNRSVEHHRDPESSYEIESADRESADFDTEDVPDSPWTIEAVDGEVSEKDAWRVPSKDFLPELAPKLFNRPLNSEESGGEEILYPRHQIILRTNESAKIRLSAIPSLLNEKPRAVTCQQESQRRNRKTTSDVSAVDRMQTLTTRNSTVRDVSDKGPVRKHKSLIIYTAPSISTKHDSRAKEVRKESGVELKENCVKSSISKALNHHTRRRSASSFTNPESPVHRIHNDNGHLPSNSSVSILCHSTSATDAQHYLSQTTFKGSLPSSTNVAHSLLRGTQEGWSNLDDKATAEALRKLDGLHGKTARTRATAGIINRTSNQVHLETLGKFCGQGATEYEKLKKVNHDHTNGPSAAHEVEDPITCLDDDHSGVASGTDKAIKKGYSSGSRSSLTDKRGSTSSFTAYTSTPSSRDSASTSGATSMTSVSTNSGRHSMIKTRRNSASSDISSVHSSDPTSIKDRVASLAINGDHPSEDALVPPVPPLPKDLSTYRSLPPTSSGSTPHICPSSESKVQDVKQVSLVAPVSPLEIVPGTTPDIAKFSYSQSHRLSQNLSSGCTSSHSAPETTDVSPKTPSKKWSFSNALSLKISGSASLSDQNSSLPLGSRAVSFGKSLRRTSSRERDISFSMCAASKALETKQPSALLSAGLFNSTSSVGSTRPIMASLSKTPDRGHATTRPGVGLSNNNQTSSSGLAASRSGPFIPSSSVHRGQSKRLTTSSIPFFRRSSSQSMQFPAGSSFFSSSSTLPLSSPSSVHTTYADTIHLESPSTASSGSTLKKSSVLSLGLPSLLKSSSRRSLYSDSKQAIKDSQKDKDSDGLCGKVVKPERVRLKREDKDRSESRISVLMGRKRGKTLSSSHQRKPKSPISLPPMQMPALEPATAQLVARLRSSPTNSVSHSVSSPGFSTSRYNMSHTVSSLKKLSDSSLRSRNQLPTIAGSPSVVAISVNKDHKENSTSLILSSSALKETPTKIPRISGRSSTAASPPLTAGSCAVVNVDQGISSTDPYPVNFSTPDDFGGLEYDETPVNTIIAQSSICSSPSTPSSRAPRQSVTSSITSTLRKEGRDSVFFTNRKASTGSAASISTPFAPSESSNHHRFSALSPSKSKPIIPKTAVSTNRPSSNVSKSVHQAFGTPSPSRPSILTSSPTTSTLDEERLIGDEEMLNYIRRQQAKKIAAGATQVELDEMLHFPEPLPPGTSSSPALILNKFPQYLSEYEKKEILEFPAVYYFGEKIRKSLAANDHSASNFGYDDERGDYVVVNRDHLAYRYEIIDILGKGSFGQVLQCRDHCTGECVAVKIIRNKRRFHHQALVEIKILDNLRKWDPDNQHHVLKMIEHFYFRNHLCIATELLSINLYELIKANGFVGFTTALIRRFTNQLLMSLALMRHHRIVHCDLKPENVLLRYPTKSAIEVIDFGSSCFEHEKIYTYIQSRFYRSPEVILGMNYHMAIDMWSLGCILAELYTGFPIFPGENEQEQLSCIMEVLGVPDKEYVSRSSRRKLFFDPNGVPRTVINSKGRRRRPGTKTLTQVLRCNDEEFVDFISKCLVWDPERRIKPQAAMRHPFVTAGKRPKVPPVVSKISSITLTNSRSKPFIESPKKSLISAPTPLTAKSSRNVTGAGLNYSNITSTFGSSKFSKTSQSQALMTSYPSTFTSRT